MNQQNALIAALIAILAFAGLAAGNYYFVRPALQPDMARMAPPPSPRSPADTAESNFTAVSLANITGAAVTEFDPRRVARNPFLWPLDEHARMLAELHKRVTEREVAEEKPEFSAAVAGAAGKEPAHRHTLKMILIGEMGKIALIDRLVLFEGDQIGDNTVYRINPLEVVLHTPTHEEIILGMAEAPRMLAPPPTDRSESVTRVETALIPRNDDLAGQRNYLRQELRMFQEGEGIQAEAQSGAPL